ncbi:hypothetical protein [Sphingobium sufflavum]|uniref:hypothetical protein n=1 Tax=Sphingobium sufflavum TaxID=1129547 RepID=UPI001F489429|nr:hypothetical protein [Sphingobium sufflavum]
MTDIDGLLEEMRGVATDPRLMTLETVVLAGAAVRRDRSAARRNLAVTGLLALGVGLGASIVSPQGASARQANYLNAIPASAPSSLLMGNR